MCDMDTRCDNLPSTGLCAYREVGTKVFFVRRLVVKIIFLVRSIFVFEYMLCVFLWPNVNATYGKKVTLKLLNNQISRQSEEQKFLTA